MRLGESILSWKSDAVVVDVLVNACVHTVESKLLQFAKADSCYRFLLYAGLVVAESGSWILQDGTLPFHNFVKAFRAGCGGTGPIDVATYLEGDWNASVLAKCAKRVRINPEKPTASGNDVDVVGFTKFASVVASHVTVEVVQNLLLSTDVIGVVPFNRPTVNIFQAGNGLSALFGVRGFSMLVDTGFQRRTCGWDFLRHMDHIDVMILPQVGESNVLGAKSFAERLALGDVRTAVGHVFINAGHASALGKAAGDGVAGGDSAAEQSDSLRLSLSEVSTHVVECLSKVRILCAPCVTKVSPQAVNLYHKIGFGSVDMYVLNPIADSKDLKDFLAILDKKSKARGSKLADLVSISSLVVFKPETRGDRPVRILFPGSSPVTKLYEGLDRLKSNPLFQTADGSEKLAGQRSAGDRGTARPGTGSGKPHTARPVSTTSSKTTTKGSVKMTTESSAAVAESKKTPSESAAAKTRDQKTLGDAKTEPKNSAANQKDTKTQPPTSTPKGDAQKPSAEAAAKGNATTPTKKVESKPMPSPIGDKTESPRRNDKRSADIEAEFPAADEPDVAPPDDVAVSDTSGILIPELVPCTAEKDTPAVSGVESQIFTEEADNHVGVSAAADSIPVSDPVTSGMATDGDEAVAGTKPLAAGESVENEAAQAGEEVDPLKSWDGPQGLPAPSDGKTVGSMPPNNSERRGAAGKSASSTTAASRRSAAAARPASSATAGAKKAAPAKAVAPFYVDLAFVPTYAVDGCDAEFFRHVRARYYVIPGSSADPHYLSMLADAKLAWDGEVTVIPTGNTDALIRWIMAHRDELALLKIEVTPSVARSTVQLDRGSTCSAYRLEF